MCHWGGVFGWMPAAARRRAFVLLSRAARGNLLLNPLQLGEMGEEGLGDDEAACPARAWLA